MKMKRRKSKGYLALLLAAVLLVPQTFTVKAEELSTEALSVDLDQYAAEDGVLKLYLNHNQGSGFTLTPDMLKVMFGSNEMETQSIKTLAEANVPVSYKCIVDVSGSMSQERIDQAKEVIKGLAESKKPEDSIAITAMGNELIQSEYMTDPAAIAEKADMLTLTHEDTNLYKAIVDELALLKTSDEVNRKRCLIIFSDGADDQANGSTQGEAEKAVEDSHIPIFTVALMKNAENSNDLEMAKVLGSFARLSSGGVHFNPALGEGQIGTIAGSVIGTLDQSFVIEESLEDVDVSGKEALIKATVSVNGQTASDQMTVPESDIKVIRQEQEKLEVVEEATEAVTETETEAEEEAGSTILGIPSNLFWILLIAIAAAVVALIFLFLFLRKRKQADEEFTDDAPVLTEQPEDGPQGTELGPNGMQMGFGGGDGLSVTESLSDGSRTVGGAAFGGSPTVGMGKGTAQASGGSGTSLTLTRMGGGTEQTYQIKLNTTYTIGRSASKAQLAITKDEALSGLHCTLSAQNGRVYVKDEGSMNGTFVNGVPIDGKFELHSDDVLLIGSYEYRVSWK